MIRMVVFDIAGTTVDENNIVYKTLRNTINKEGFDFTLEQVLETGAGKEKQNAIRDIIAMSYPQVNEILAARIYSAFAAELASAYHQYELLPQEGADDVFASLRESNILVVLNTGYNAAMANAVLEKIGWQVGVHIDALITASDVSNNRPHPDMILLAMQKFNISNPAEVVKVGDSAIDIREGKNAGCGLSIGITTGAHNFEQLEAANPDYIINSLAELLPLL